MKNCQVEEDWLSNSFFWPVVIAPSLYPVWVILCLVCHPGLFLSPLCPCCTQLVLSPSRSSLTHIGHHLGCFALLKFHPYKARVTCSRDNWRGGGGRGVFKDQPANDTHPSLKLEVLFFFFFAWNSVFLHVSVPFLSYCPPLCPEKLKITQLFNAEL